ncbi:hypothetical protein [Streptomyces sp. URMC 129]|uniref:hypothetical protein n=1 Tax=Streptomyces sp. URMC 129 TaxID=3423407 RepID=UPI003F1CBCC1
MKEKVWQCHRFFRFTESICVAGTIPGVGDMALLVKDEWENRDDVAAKSGNGFPHFEFSKERVTRGGEIPSGQAASDAAGVCLGVVGGGFLVLPLATDCAPTDVRPTFERLVAEETTPGTIDAARWLMPNLSRALIVEVLGLGAGHVDGP